MCRIILSQLFSNERLRRKKASISILQMKELLFSLFNIWLLSNYLRHQFLAEYVKRSWEQKKASVLFHADRIIHKSTSKCLSIDICLLTQSVTASYAEPICALSRYLNHLLCYRHLPRSNGFPEVVQILAKLEGTTIARYVTSKRLGAWTNLKHDKKDFK